MFNVAAFPLSQEDMVKYRQMLEQQALQTATERVSQLLQVHQDYRLARYMLRLRKYSALHTELSEIDCSARSNWTA
jgi:hypothetical protein